MDTEEIWLRQLAQDHRSGAAEIVAGVAERLRADLAAWIADPGRLARFGLRSIAAQPSMAPLINLFNDLLWACDRSPGDLAVAERILSSYIVPVGIVPLPHYLCPPGSVVLSFSYSSSVLRTLLATKERVKHVICLESRPLFEGRTLAQRLAEGRIPATVVIDAAMAEMIERADLAVVGADCIHPGGFINKRGTTALALLAAALRKTIIPVISRSKLLSREAAKRFIRIAQRDPAEVWTPVPHSVSVENRYFDSTPLNLFNIFFLDANVSDREHVEELLEAHRLHSLLLVPGPGEA